MDFFHPERFQGRLRRRSYFEGWYFKQVSADASAAWSFIPGISFGPDGRGEAFVQAIDGSTGTTEWYPYPVEAFSAARGRFEVRVGESVFSLEGARVRLGEGAARIEADLAFESPVPYPATFLSPGIMGPYSWVPFMECRHGLVSMDHGVSGEVRARGCVARMDGGRGYVEKDWGSSMPSSWIWSQTNSFPSPGDSFMLSVARIPWLGGSFTGFLCVLRADGRLRRFASYTGHRLERIEVGERDVRIRIAGRGQELSFESHRERAGFLAAPVRGVMSRRIAESIDAKVRVELRERALLIWSGESSRAGLELVGDSAELIAVQPRG
ncbi:MAG: hypothetical protein JXA15_14725 [Spirochaetales bacterium]|nr:hypothetical protein [Spirochaetales bacterium]